MNTLNEYRDAAFANASAKGFHDEDRGNATYLMLTVSELSEALEADRKGKHNEPGDAKLVSEYQDTIFKHSFELLIKDRFADELADAMIRIFDLCGKRGIDIQSHVDAKMKYNAMRPHKHGKAY